ncbi:hypothetical protein [Chitinophaga sp. CF118]|uniref:hypothetical protein n=1 Tax=Chitinophaga sp. CF118 TaxID=1884367 RepID=UPI001160C811|nr:hypothetical protein [Chitinophaga sp. CF118]
MPAVLISTVLIAATPEITHAGNELPIIEQDSSKPAEKVPVIKGDSTVPENYECDILPGYSALGKDIEVVAYAVKRTPEYITGAVTTIYSEIKSTITEPIPVRKKKKWFFWR